MNAVKKLLEKYSLEVPNTQIGVFENDELQELYFTLYNKGINSLYDAFEVGKIIEETDIKDLQELMISSTDDIISVLEKLLNGSYNHLKAFNSKL